MIALVLTLALTASPPPTSKDNGAAQAKALFQAGQRLYKEGKYAEAATQFEAAYTARPHPVIFFNLGRCYEMLDEPAKAIKAYEEYLRQSPEAKDKVSVTQMIRQLRAKSMAQLTVVADPANARIELDGNHLGSSPASVELEAGNHRLVVTAEGYETVERSFLVAAQRSMDMSVSLRPLPKEPEPVAPSAQATPPVPPSDVPTREEPTEPPPSRIEPAPESVRPAAAPVAAVHTTPERSGRTWTWVSAGVGAVSLGAGIALGLSAQGAATELKSRPHPQADAQLYYDQAQLMSAGANVSYGVAAAAALTAGILFLVEGP